MSSANAVEVIAVPETVYGQTPVLDATVAAGTVRFVSEALSGTPTTTTSAEIRNDRMSSGQVVTGLESGGDINFELSSDPVFDQFFSGAMMDVWTAGSTSPVGAITLTKHAAPNDQTATIGVASTTGLAPGDVVVLSGFVNAINNGPVQVISITNATTFEAIVPRAAVTETTATGGAQVPDYVDIGTTPLSWSLSKAYTDTLHLLTTDQHSQRYSGSLVNRMSINIAYGEIVTGTFGFMSNGYVQEAPSLHQQIETAGGTVAIAGTANPLNGSVDMPMVTIDGSPTDFCIQSLGLELDNGLTPQNCIGHIAPMKYTLGTASINITSTIYLGDQSYDKFMPAKLSMVPISMLFAALNADGGYAFDLRAVQLTFPDPSASGTDQPVLIEAAGSAKVGEDGDSALRIWKW